MQTLNLDTWQRDGVVFPVDVLTPTEAAEGLRDYADINARMSNWTDTQQLPKVHVLSERMWKIVSHPELLTAVKQLIGPDVLCWGGTFFAKAANSGGYVGWHQDLTYWGLEPACDVVTAWLALTDAKIDNGCMSVIAGSQHHSLREHRNIPGTDNMLLSGQEAIVEQSDLDKAVHCELAPGQASIHHSMALHGSNPNNSNRSRVGLSIQYISADVKQNLNGGVDSAMPVCGDTSRSSLVTEAIPSGEFSDAAIQCWLDNISHPSGLGATAEGFKLSASIDAIGATNPSKD